jgi:8-oxo-dGTP pyrophosphatase MutT (NUDIX family)
MNLEPYEARFPSLFHEMFCEWGPITAQFRATTEPPPPETIIKVRVVPFIGDNVVILKMADGNWDHPGGTLEPGENYLDALERESLEEAGAKITNFEIFGVFDCSSHNPEPYRPHYPHPNFTQIIGFGDAELVSEPVAPLDGEYEVIEQVDVVNLDEAVRRLEHRSDGHWQADMYRLAAELRS